MASGSDATASGFRILRTIPCVIWLLRHADAEDEAEDDASRPLTDKGTRQSKAAAAALAKLEVDLDVCLTSPKLRSVQTARIVAEELGLEVEETEALRGGDFDLDGLTAGRGDVLLVGHEPDFSRAVQIATGGRVELKKGGLAVIDDNTLISVLRPAQLRAIAGL
jgi:phosphohistidine phosphatase